MDKYKIRKNDINPLRHITLDDALSKCITHFNKVGAHKFLYSPQMEDKHIRELFIVIMFVYGLRKITGREWLIQEFVTDPPDFELIAFSDRKLEKRPIDRAIGELVEIPAILKEINSDDKLIEIEKIIQKKNNKQYNLGTVLLVFINVPVGNAFHNGVIEAIEKNTEKFKNVWILRIIAIDDKQSFICEIKEIKPKSNNRVVINLLEEIGKGIMFNHKYMDKFKEKDD